MLPFPSSSPTNRPVNNEARGLVNLLRLRLSSGRGGREEGGGGGVWEENQWPTEATQTHTCVRVSCVCVRVGVRVGEITNNRLKRSSCNSPPIYTTHVDNMHGAYGDSQRPQEARAPGIDCKFRQATDETAYIYMCVCVCVAFCNPARRVVKVADGG